MPARWVFYLLLLSPLLLRAAEPEILPADRAPALRLVDLNGRSHDIEALGGRTLLVTFWASWCRPCVEEMPALERLKTRFADRPFALLAVDAGDTESAARAFVARQQLSLEVLVDEPGDTTRAWGVKVLPSAFLIDTRGRIRARYLGPYDWDSSEAIGTIEGLLAGDDRGLPLGTPR